ncbi:glycosyltransferase [Chloroflexota bacterium]
MKHSNQPRKRLLIISHDIIATMMAGPGIRYLEMARALKDDLDITLAIPSETNLDLLDISFSVYSLNNPSELQDLVESHDVILFSSFILEKFPFLGNTKKCLVVDLYDPFVFENLHYYVDERLSAQDSLNKHSIDVTNQLARASDFFICGNERQRDYWMGALTANERINPRTFNQDPTFRSLIDVVGTGIPDRAPRSKPFLRGVHPQFPNNSKIVLWGGGIWDWLDPLTLVLAWTQVISEYPEARLIFLGTRHPNPDVPVHEISEKVQNLAVELGHKDHTIFFFEWLTREEHEALLAEADIGVTLHPIHAETRYSLRTRVLDYIWAGLPTISTEGDVTSEWVRQYNLGDVVPANDIDAVANSLCTLLQIPKDEWINAFKPLQEDLRWTRVVEPLRQFCLNPKPAADHIHRPRTKTGNFGPETINWRLARARYILRKEGFRSLFNKVWHYLKNRPT